MFNPNQQDFSIVQERAYDDVLTWDRSRDALTELAKLDWLIAAYAFTCDDRYIAGHEALDVEANLAAMRDDALQYCGLDAGQVDWLADNAAHADSLVMQYVDAKLKEMVI